jgi:hypothetical protein
MKCGCKEIVPLRTNLGTSLKFTLNATSESKTSCLILDTKKLNSRNHRGHGTKNLCTSPLRGGEVVSMQVTYWNQPTYFNKCSIKCLYSKLP